MEQICITYFFKSGKFLAKFWPILFQSKFLNIDKALFWGTEQIF